MSTMDFPLETRKDALENVGLDPLDFSSQPLNSVIAVFFMEENYSSKNNQYFQL